MCCVQFNPGQRNPSVMWGDAHALRFSNATFGTVYVNVLDHILGAEQFVEEAHRVLAARGTLFVDMDQNEPDEWTVRDLREEREDLERLFDDHFERVSRILIPTGEEKDAPKYSYVFRKRQATLFGSLGLGRR